MTYIDIYVMAADVFTVILSLGLGSCFAWTLF